VSSTHFISREHCPACCSTERQSLFVCDFFASPIREHLVMLYEDQGTIELEYLEGGTYHLLECKACGLVYQEQVADEFLQERLYEHWIDPARALERRRVYVDLSMRFAYVREILLGLSYLGRAESRLSVLDFGMGWGEWCLMAKAFGCQVSGLDSSPSRLAHARANGIPVVGWEELPHVHFDFINCEQVLEHLNQPYETLEQLGRSLQPRGLLKLSVPDGGNIKRRLAWGNWAAGEGHPESLLSVTPLQHINCFPRASLLRIARRAGLRPARIPLSHQYASSADRCTPRHLFASLTRPLGRRLFTRDTYLYFEREPEPTP
jgi:SAM-dependent methyltransferase